MPRAVRATVIEDDRRGFLCPYCGTDESPVTVQQTSTCGWVVVAALLVTCLPLCWLGLYITEEYHECDDCGVRLD